jgi:hypoxanthine phosphoribosyltransferase
MVDISDKHNAILYFTHNDFMRAVEKLSDNIYNLSFIPDGLLVLPRGGMQLGLHLSHKLDIPVLNEVKSENTIIIDDICDSGKTLSKYPKNYKCVLVTKQLGKKNIDKLIYFTECEDTTWLHFYWEKNLGNYKNITEKFDKILEENKNE